MGAIEFRQEILTYSCSREMHTSLKYNYNVGARSSLQACRTAVRLSDDRCCCGKADLHDVNRVLRLSTCLRLQTKEQNILMLQCKHIEHCYNNQWHSDRLFSKPLLFLRGQI